MPDIEGLSAQAVLHLMLHMSGQQVLSHGTLANKVKYLCEQVSLIEDVTVRTDIDQPRVLETLSLVVAKKP